MTGFLPSPRTLDYLPAPEDCLVLRISARDRDLAQQVPGLKFHKADETWRGAPLLSTGLALRGVFGNDLDVTDAVYERLAAETERASAVLAVKNGERHPAENDPAVDGLFPPQKDAAWCAALQAGFLIADEKGAGKTVEAAGALNIAAAGGPGGEPGTAYPALVVSTNSMKYGWAEEIEKWCKVPVVVAGRTPTLRKSAIEKVRTGEAMVLVMSWEQLRLHSSLAPYGSVARSDAEKEPKELNAVPFKTVIADECVPDTTLIETRRGRVPICDVHVGDLVLGVDHTTGDVVWSEVKATMTSPDRPLVQVGALHVTPEHPVWSPPLDTLCYASLYAENYQDRQDMRVVRDSVPDNESGRALLLQELFFPKSSDPGDKGRITQAYAGIAGTIRRSGQVGSTPCRTEQPGSGPCGPGASTGGEQGEGLSDLERGQWEGTYRPAADFARPNALRVGDGTGGRDFASPTWIPVLLQAGHWESGPPSGHRGPRGGASGEGPAGTGSEEAGVSSVSGVDDLRSLEQGRNGRPLWNLETATGNYVANGVLVHNCHRSKNPKTKTTRALWAVGHGPSVVNRWALSATPITGNTVDLWGPLHFIRPDMFPSRSKFIDRYVRVFTNVWGGVEDLGLRPDTEPEFRKILDPLFIRRPLRIDARLLPVQHRFVDMEGRQLSTYRKFEKDSIAKIDGKYLVAVGSLVVNTRLQQLAQATPVLEDVPDPETGEPRTQVTALKLPSCKYDALCDLLDEMGGEPLVVFSDSRKLLELCYRELTTPKGRTPARFRPEQVGLITGKVSSQDRHAAITAFQEGSNPDGSPTMPLIMCTIGAGSEGITLTRASTMCFLNRSYREVGNNQAEGRLYRHGQDRDVQIIDIITRDSEELRVYEATARKADRMQDIVQDDNFERRELPQDGERP